MLKKYFIVIGSILFLCFQTGLSQQITIEGNEFRANSKKIWLNGANTPWHNWNDLGGDFNYQWWDNHFKSLHQAGTNNTRVWLTCNGDVGMDITSDGYVNGPTNAFWEDMDSLMSIARRHKVYIMGALISFDHTASYTEKHDRWRKMYESEENMDAFVENYAVLLVKRYKDNPYLFSIDVCNEILWVSESEHNDQGNYPWSTLQYLVGKTAQRVHEESDVLVCVSNYLKYTSPKFRGNKWSDTALQGVVDDEDAYLDFYKIHYYPWVYPHFDGFHAEKSPAYFEIDEKPCITGEFSAHGVFADKSTGTKFLMGMPKAYEIHYQNGWQGAQAWTSNGVDSNGDLDNNLREATITFKNRHFDLIDHPHSASNPSDPYFNYGGRIDFSNVFAPTMYYGGSYVQVKFAGTSLKAIFSDYKSKVPLEIHFVIDSTAVDQTLPQGASRDTLEVISGLKDTLHELTIAKAEGPGAGSFGLQFHGLVLDNDTAIFPAEKPNLKIEVFGDSFTGGVGSGCIGTYGDCGNNNAWYSYANILAREMNARIHNNGIGGLAVMDNTGWYQSKTTGLETTYDKLIPTHENGLSYADWDFSAYTPDLVLFAMGVNDEYDPNETAFADTTRWKSAYKSDIRDLVNHYGEDVKIIVAPGNLYAKKAYKYSESLVKEMKSQGYNIWFYRYSFEVNAHPNKAEHEAMAKELKQFILDKEILNYPGKNPILYELKINPGNGAVSVNPEKEAYPAGETVTLRAFPPDGYWFSGWSGDKTAFQQEIELVMNSRVEINAYYKKKALTGEFIDDADSRITYKGEWNEETSGNLYQGSAVYTADYGATVHFNFTGTGISLYGVGAPGNSNHLKLTIDREVKENMLSLKTPTPVAHHEIIIVKGLVKKEHELVLENLKYKTLYFDYAIVDTSSSSTTVNYIQKAGKHALYPNPVNAKGQLFINMGNKPISGKLNVSIFSCLGKKIMDKEYPLEGQVIHLDTKCLEKGWYIIKIQSGKTSVMEKLVIK